MKSFFSFLCLQCDPNSGVFMTLWTEAAFKWKYYIVEQQVSQAGFHYYEGVLILGGEPLSIVESSTKAVI